MHLHTHFNIDKIEKKKQIVNYPLINCIGSACCCMIMKPILYEPGSLARARVRRIPAFLWAAFTTYVTILHPQSNVNCFFKKTPEKQQAETAPYGRKKGCRRGGAGKLISPAVFGIPHSQLRSLPFSKTAALGLAHSPGSVSQNRDPLCTALMVVVIQAAQNIAVHLQPGFRRLKQVFEQASACLLYTSDAADD